MVPYSRLLGRDFSLLLSRCSDLIAVTPVNAPSENWKKAEPYMSFWLKWLHLCCARGAKLLSLSTTNTRPCGSQKADRCTGEGISPVSLWHESLLSSFLLHQHLCKHGRSLPSSASHGAKNFREVLDEPICIASSFVSSRRKRRADERERERCSALKGCFM